MGRGRFRNGNFRGRKSFGVNMGSRRNDFVIRLSTLVVTEGHHIRAIMVITNESFGMVDLNNLLLLHKEYLSPC